MTKWLSNFLHSFISALRTRRDLVFENLLLKQQLTVLKQEDILAIDFFTVPTATFRVLFVLVILSHDRRELLHTNVTESPTAAWSARQVYEAIGIDMAPKYLIRDWDAKFGGFFSRQVALAGLR